MNKLSLFASAALLSCSAQFACAGGIETPAPANGIFFGVGGAVDWIQYRPVTIDPYTGQGAGGFAAIGFIQAPLMINITPVGQLGYEHYFNSGAMVGIKGLYNFVNKYNNMSGLSSPNPDFHVGSMIAALIEAGYRFSSNAFYFELGYSALFTNLVVRDQNLASFVQGVQSEMISGATAGIGYRRFFTPNLFIDAVYSMSAYLDGNAFVTPGLSNELITEGTDFTRIQKIFEGDLTFTVNYMINF